VHAFGPAGGRTRGDDGRPGARVGSPAPPGAWSAHRGLPRAPPVHGVARWPGDRQAACPHRVVLADDGILRRQLGRPVRTPPSKESEGMADTALDAEFTLDLRVVEAALPVGNLLLSTSDNCGNTCEKDAWISFTGDPS